MEQAQAEELRFSLQDLSLDTTEDEATLKTEKVLLGKFMSTRPFRRFKLTNILRNIWRTNQEIKVEKMGENVFKFIFSTKEDKEKIFRRRPWNVDGSHLILKEWSSGVGFQEVDFTYSDFFLQVHGLPPNLMNQSNAIKIGEKLGQLDLASIERCVIGTKYLRFRVTLKVDSPLPAGYFLKRGRGDEIWIQFKIERLSDFCYKCGRLSHVTGRCLIEGATTITTNCGIVAKLYEPWLRAEDAGNLLFVNPTEEPQRRRKYQDEMQLVSRFQETHAHSGESNSNWVNIEGDQIPQVDAKVAEDNAACFRNALEMCPQLRSLHLTLKQNDFMKIEDLQSAVLQNIKKHHLSTKQIEDWVNDLLQAVATTSAQYNSHLATYGPEIFEWIWATPGRVEEANQEVTLTPTKPIKKRPPQSLLDLPGGARGAKLSGTFGLDCEELVEESPQDREQPVEVIAEAATQLALSETPSFHLGTGVSTHQSGGGSRSRRWKRDARNRLSRESPVQSPLQQCTPKNNIIISSNEAGMSKTTSDFWEAGEASQNKPPPRFLESNLLELSGSETWDGA